VSPDQPDVISFGHVRTDSYRVARAAVVLLSAALAIAITVAVHYHGQVEALHRQARNAPSRAASPTPAPRTALRSAGPIEVVNGNSLRFAVKGTTGAVVSVEYLRADHGRETMWLTVAISGLPLGWMYSATAGRCLQGRPVSLTTTGGIPDRHSGILLLPLNGVPVSTTEVTWLDLKTARGVLLGGIRGNFLVGQATTPIAPDNVCTGTPTVLQGGGSSAARWVLTCARIGLGQQLDSLCFAMVASAVLCG
jgi:hypothetical protein